MDDAGFATPMGALRVRRAARTTVRPRKTPAPTMHGETMIEPIAMPAPLPNGAGRLRHGIIDSPWLRWLARFEERRRRKR